MPHHIISDNTKQFKNANTLAFCKKLGISKNFSSIAHPKANSQVEAVNKIIKVTLKTRLDNNKGKKADELHKVL
ncbi:DDE-type integrase/transposase/recombinase, partial [Proteus mirabilis]|uniref:DDE-type integrase/transposase/recombinase n=1 Tax=Proteus mirabilis TaxID=584 RepID=UPI0015C56933